MEERLQKLLSARGVASRRTAEQMIEAGRVTVNGVRAELGMRADPERDAILVDGAPLPEAESYRYILLYKPRGYVTTMRDERGRKTVAELVDCGFRVYPVGRLDQWSEGLLLLTNDGDWANALMHPSREVEKEYLVWVSGYRPGAEKALETPIELDGRPIAPPEVRLLKAAEGVAQFRIVIHEGRNRQIRRMCQAAGLTVTRLKRIREGALCLGDLKAGQWRYLTPEEAEQVHAL